MENNSLPSVLPYGDGGNIVVHTEEDWSSVDYVKVSYGLKNASSPVEQHLVPKIRQEDVVWTTKREEAHGQEVPDIIGTGYYGVVYRAVLRYQGREKPVVVKQNDLDRSEQYILQEAQFLQLLNGTGYTPWMYGLVLGCDQSLHRGLGLVQSAFGDGVTLGDIKSDSEKLPVQHRPYVAWHLAVGLKAIHDRGVVVNDLHVNNVLVDPYCYPPVRYIDFGCATFGSVDNIFSVDPYTTVAPHLAPEILNGQPMTPEADIYSLGFIIQQLNNDIDGYWPPPLMQEAEEKCMDEDPKKRPDLEEVISMLRKC